MGGQGPNIFLGARLFSGPEFAQGRWSGGLSSLRVLVCTDAWHPQVNGVVRTYEHLSREVRALGGSIEFVAPPGFASIALPTYREIRLAFVRPGDIARRVREIRPEFIHIATEGPIGLAARAYCRRRGHPFTTSYHTRFPDYVAARLPVPRSWTYRLQRWFHSGGRAMMVSSQTLADDLGAQGFSNILVWPHGVDTVLFRPRDVRLFSRDRPVFLYVGRVAVEKNLEAFLALDLPGERVVVGGGPALARLRARFPDCTFTGPMHGEDLARCYASADVFVFPSLTDTFGNVLLEAMACGVPVAAFPVIGPKDIVANGRSGVLDDDLGAAALAALALDRGEVRRHAVAYSWRSSAESFLANIRSANGQADHSRGDGRDP